MAQPLNQSYVIGINTSVKGHLCFLDDTDVVYPSGHGIVTLDCDTRVQRIVQGTLSSHGITAMATSGNKRYTAFAEGVSDKHPVITVYDWPNKRRRKVINNIDMGSSVVHSMSFSSDTKYLILQGGAPEWNCVLLHWEKGKVSSKLNGIGTLTCPVRQFDASPADSNLFAASCNNMFRMFRLGDGALRPVVVTIKREVPDCLCHAWLPEDRLVVGTLAGELLLFEGMEYKQSLSAAPNDGFPIKCLHTFSKGFIAGCTDGIIRIYERSADARELYKRTKKFKINDQDSAVAEIALSPSEDTLLCTLENGQAFTLSLSNTELIKPTDVKFESMLTTFPGVGKSGSKAVTGMDVCLRKPIVVTTSADRTLRVWNYSPAATNKPAGEFIPTLDLTKHFDDDPICVALHPSGLQAAVAFPSYLRLMNILMDDIVTYKELSIKSCTEARFSNGGQYIAFANSASVTIVGTYTCEVVCTLRGHSDRVTSLVWSEDDLYLYSSSLDGTIVKWEATTGKTKSTITVPGCGVTGFALPPVTEPGQSQEMYVVGESHDDRRSAPFKIIDVATGDIRADIDLAGSQFGHVLVSQGTRMIVASSSDPGKVGVVRAYKLPLTGEFFDFVGHGGPITKLCMSPDETIVITCALDGTISFFTTLAYGRGSGGAGGGAGGAVKRTGEKDSGLDWAEEILVTKSDLEASNIAKSELQAKVAELTLHHQYRLRLKDLNYAEKIKEVEDKFQEELAADKAKYSKLLSDKESMEGSYEDRIAAFEARQARELEELEATYKQKIAAEIERYDKLIANRDVMSQQWDKANAAMIANHQEHIAKILAEHEAKVNDEENHIRGLEKDKSRMLTEIEVRSSIVEKDADMELDQIRAKYESKLAAEKRSTLLLKGENGIMRKKFAQLTKELNDGKDELRALREKEKEMNDLMRGLEKDILGHKKEIREREETVMDKDKRIYDLRKKNQELEKFKFVLNYKIQELKRQIMPKKKEIQDMRDQMKEMEVELLQYHKSNAALDLMIGELRLKKDGLQREHDTVDTTLTAAQAQTKAMRQDVYDASNRSVTLKALKAAVNDLYSKYIVKAASAVASAQNTGATSSVSEEEVQAEYARQRSYLERTLDNLKRKAAKEADLVQQDRTKLLRENAVLVEEINNLRREIRLVQQECACTEMGIDVSAAVTQPLPPPGPKQLGNTSSRTAGSITTRNMSIGGVLRIEDDGSTSRTATTRGTSGRLKGATQTQTLALPPAAPQRSVDGMLRESEMQRSTIAQLQLRLEALRESVLREPLLGHGALDGRIGLSTTDDGVERRPESRQRLLPSLPSPQAITTPREYTPAVDVQ